VADLPSVYFDHPDIQEAYLNGEHLPDGHPSVSSLLQKVLPIGHPDVDDLFLDHEELPEWHPDLNLIVQDNPIEPIYVFSGHPDLTDDDEIGEPVDDHPTVHHLFAEHIPDSHPNIDDLMQEGFVLPSWHPKIGSIVIPRSSFTSPGFLLCAGVTVLFIVFLAARVITKWRNSKRTTEIVVTRSISTDKSDGGNDEVSVSSSDEGDIEVVMQRDNVEESYINPNEDRVLVYKEKRANWKKVFGKRIAATSNSSGEVLLCLLYLVVNLAALWASPDHQLGIGLGSLSAGNTVVTFLTAARNSVFTGFLGVAFDQVLVYHRFIGRLTVALALAHSCFYIDYVLKNPTDYVTLTGFICLGCGVIIFITSFNYIRRHYFNLFFWFHCGSFLGFVVALFLHATAARPFVLASLGSYAIDKAIQLSRKMTKNTTAFENLDDRTARVRFAKTQLSSLLCRHQVGQYVFVNFPSLSLQEWHPFSVASGPNAPYIDIYVRALGDHSKKIVEYSKKCAAENKQAKIRVDGPYGTLPFNYHRYGSILLVGGGIGITPIMGILDDIYGRVGNGRMKKRAPSHCIKNVSVVWIMPHAADATLFSDLLDSYHLKSLVDPLVPDLELSIYVTRDDGTLAGKSITYAKPQFNIVLGELVENKHESLTSILVYACGPGRMVNQLWDESMKKRSKKLRVDFYHENFEF
jgi:predicted ferric reductase